jgi:predicted RNase H-like nuclease (RuvC/YqgF family)
MATRRTPEPTRRAKARVTRKAAPRTSSATSLKAANARLVVCRRRITTLETQLARLGEARTAERAAARQRMARARRQFEARLTRMVQEIGALRHHEVRLRTLERTLAEKEREIERLSELLEW